MFWLATLQSPIRTGGGRNTCPTPLHSELQIWVREGGEEERRLAQRGNAPYLGGAAWLTRRRWTQPRTSARLYIGMDTYLGQIS